MLTPDRAIALADRRQHRAVREAAGFAASLGGPVGFVRRAVPGGTVFEAVALDSARTCAVVDERGALRLAPRAVGRDASGRTGDDAPVAVAAPRVGAATRRAAERALATAARPVAGRP
jgi:hypothetical protein